MTSHLVKLFKALKCNKTAKGVASLRCRNVCRLDHNLHRQGAKLLLCLVTREQNFSTALQSYWRPLDELIASTPQSPTER